MNGKEKKRITEQITKLEKELVDSLTKKSNRVKEIDLTKQQTRIAGLRKQLRDNE